MPRRRLRAVTAVLAVLAMLVPFDAAADELDAVVKQRKEAEQRLTAATTAYEQLRGKVEEARYDLEQLEKRATELEARKAAVSERLQERARRAFMHGSNDMITTIMSADGPEGVVERVSLLSAVTGRDRGELEGATNLRAQLDQMRVLLADKAEELSKLEAEMTAQRADLQAELEALKVEEHRIRTRADRLMTIQQGAQQGVYACAMDPEHTTFIDSWGFPRSGGRSHEGVDLMAPYGVPVYAFTSGEITRMKSGGLGGIVLYLWGDDGNEYYYAHLSGYAEGAAIGKRVEAGDLIAYNGDSGNASGGDPHVHFEVHPGGGAPVNPYPWMAPPCAIG